jgi:uncharacterized membrane protein
MNNNIKAEYIKGEVTEIIEQKSDGVENFNIPKNEKFYDFKVKTDTGEYIVDAQTKEYKVGDNVYIQKIYTDRETFGYELFSKVREFEIISLLLLFVVVVFSLFGKKGLKAILSLAISLLIIFKILLPLTLEGYNPLLISGFISVLLLNFSMLITHGKNKITYIALFGCSVSIFTTIFLSYFTIYFSRISGFIDDYSSFLRYGLENPINIPLLLIASIIIGVIGAVDDGAITQAKVVAEMKVLNKSLSMKEYYSRAMSIGTSHAGSMINTLVLAYLASSFPVLIYLYTSKVPFYILINQEYVVIEIFRSLIASIGLLLAIPITTFLAVYFIKEKDLQDLSQSEITSSHHHKH